MDALLLFYRNLLSLTEAIESLCSCSHEDLIIKKSAQCVSHIFNCDKSYLIIRKNSKQYELAYAVGITFEQKKKFAITKTFTKVIENNQTLLIQNRKQIPPDTLPLVESKYLSCSFVILPISRISENLGEKKPAIGLLCASYRKDGCPFTQEDTQLLTILAGYTAIAINNARFYQDLKKKKKKLYVGISNWRKHRTNWCNLKK